ncbi:MAG TPA: hypothetical protein VF461_17670 [Gemmatimonadaceae bacterium]
MIVPGGSVPLFVTSNGCTSCVTLVDWLVLWPFGVTVTFGWPTVTTVNVRSLDVPLVMSSTCIVIVDVPAPLG